MEMFFLIAIVSIVVMSCIAFIVGKKVASKGDNQDKVISLESRVQELTNEVIEHKKVINGHIQTITTLTSERDVHKANLDTVNRQLCECKDEFEKQKSQLHQDRELEKCEINNRHNKEIEDLKRSYESQIEGVKESYNKQLKQVQESTDKQLETLREMNKKQVEDQLTLIKEQMRTTSEVVLKARQEELGSQNKEQVLKIVDPLRKSLEDMKVALQSSKEQQQEALTRLDESIKLNMKKSDSLSDTADRLTRALTGEVKIQGNFGELKLKQLLEDLSLTEGEQFYTQETLKDRYGRKVTDDEGKGRIPDFILRFPNERYVVVDSKNVWSDYISYMNAEEATEKSICLQKHIRSVRDRVNELAKKDYSKYLPSGYNKLNFVIMYIPIEGALNLALLNDPSLWREAYDKGVMILGPQTMYMNLRVLEMMWTQVRQLENQQTMMKAAETVIERVQLFGERFITVEKCVKDTVKAIKDVKTTTADNGKSIITAARQLLAAGATEKEGKKKRTLAELDSIFLETDTLMLDDKDIDIDASDLDDDIAVNQ